MWPFIHKFNSHISNIKLRRTVWQFEPMSYVNAFRFLRIENNVQVISKTECGPMPNLMVALPNIGGTLCSTAQSLDDGHYFTAVQ